jgi:hypothetical protein
LLTHFCFLSLRSFCSRKCFKLLWYVFTTKLPQTKYCRNLANACMMYRIFLSYIEIILLVPPILRLSKYMGCLFCINMAPIPYLDVSHSKMKG